MWGCGGEAVLKEQTGQKQWELKEADKLKNRKVSFIISSSLMLFVFKYSQSSNIIYFTLSYIFILYIHLMFF